MLGAPPAWPGVEPGLDPGVVAGWGQRSGAGSAGLCPDDPGEPDDCCDGEDAGSPCDDDGWLDEPGLPCEPDGVDGLDGLGELGELGALDGLGGCDDGGAWLGVAQPAVAKAVAAIQASLTRSRRRIDAFSVRGTGPVHSG